MKSCTKKPNNKKSARCVADNSQFAIKVSAIDMFCGIGGLTHGLQTAGKTARSQSGIDMTVKAGFDIDESCKFAYEHNNESDFICKDIKDTKTADLLKYYKNADFKVLVGCAPCQPFSQLTNNRKTNSVNEDSEKWGALRYFSTFVEQIKPDIVSMENVPGLVNNSIYADFIKILQNNEYKIWREIVHCSQYGVPQRRKRLVVLASRHDHITLLPARSAQSEATVKNALNRRQIPDTDSAHISYNLSAKNLERIQKSIPGKYREQWDEDMILPCHKRHNFPEPYGRMAWDQLAPTITSQFCFYSCGRFGHPEEDRAITIREGALLQTFPSNYRIIDDNASNHPDIRTLARHIGNAVPPKLGQIIGKSIISHIKKIGYSS